MKDIPGHELIELTPLGVYVTTGEDARVFILASDFDNLATARAAQLKERALLSSEEQTK